jgi:hypothetical protein
MNNIFKEEYDIVSLCKRERERDFSVDETPSPRSLRSVQA